MGQPEPLHLPEVSYSHMESSMKEKKNRKIRYISLALLFMVGLSIVLYPTISDRWNQYRADQLITAYSHAVTEEGTDYSGYLEEARRYNETLIGSPVPDAFAQREGAENPEYEAMLDISGDGVIGYVEIPAIKVNLPIYHYTSEESLKKGAGHLFGSSLPVGGESSHSVISAHRGLPDARMFTDLNLVEKGDLFYITVLSEKLAYEVDQIQVVEPWETESLAIEEDGDYVTLVTCTPYAVNTQRLLVRGHRTAYAEETYEAQAAASDARVRTSPNLWMHALCAAAGVLLAVLFVRLLSKKERKEKKPEGPADTGGKGFDGHAG